MIRTILTPSTQTISFAIPKNYVVKELEIIAFEKNEPVNSNYTLQKNVSFDALSINTKSYKFNRDYNF